MEEYNLELMILGHEIWMEKTREEKNAVQISLLFGHNMRSGTMFADVNNYSNASFYNSHRTFTVKFGDTNYTYKVFAAYDTHVNDARYMKVDFKNEEEDGTVSQFLLIRNEKL